jgi:hypothetical protein
MLVRRNSRVSSARANELGVREAMGIRRPCNTTFYQDEGGLKGPTFVDCEGKGIQ